MKAKKTRETRAAYRAKSKVHAVASGAVKPRRASSVPEGPSWQELEAWHRWESEHLEELEGKYSGKYIAIWNMEVIGSGQTWGEAFDKAREQLPGSVPWVTYIPASEEKDRVYILSC